MGLFNFDQRKDLGRKGEDVAARYLKRLGHRVLARNVVTPFGELDLVMQEKLSGRLVFVEVKARSREDVAAGEQAVGRAKQRHVIRAAQAWLKSKGLSDAPVRFDVVAVAYADAAGHGEPELRHIPGAFLA
ncbi:MAG TPA: YraN family protein [Phycisphaerae bacterium]|nr:YraN family protein [Phycisphaerae bacterium]HOI55352.1 YraN family protein [Phycisphaerae bacterium]